MTKVTAQMSISLDGFYAGPHAGPDPEQWVAKEAPGFFRVTRWVTDSMAWRERLGLAGGERSVNSEIIDETFQAAGAYVMGRRMFDGGEGPWGDDPPFAAPVFVVTNRPRETVVKDGGTSFTFVTDGIPSAIEQARAATGDKDVAIAGGGNLLRQVIKAGLVDQLELHIAPVLLGDGMRLFDGVGQEALELVPTRVVDTPDVTHVRYTVQGPAELTLDDRGGHPDWVEYQGETVGSRPDRDGEW